MKSSNRYILSGSALHITARSLGKRNPKPPLAHDRHIHQRERQVNVSTASGRMTNTSHEMAMLDVQTY